MTAGEGPQGGASLTRGQLQRIEERAHIEHVLRSARRSRWLLQRQPVTPPELAPPVEPVVLTPAQRQRMEERKHIERVLRNARRSRWLLGTRTIEEKEEPAGPPPAVSAAAAEEAVEPTPAQRQRIEEQKRIEKALREARRSRWVPMPHRGEAKALSPVQEPGQPTPAQLQRIEEQERIEQALRDVRRSRWMPKRSKREEAKGAALVETPSGGAEARVAAPRPLAERRGGWLLVAVLVIASLLLGLSIHGLFERAGIRREIGELLVQTKALAASQANALSLVQVGVDALAAAQAQQAEEWDARFGDIAGAADLGFARILEDVDGLESRIEALRVFFGTNTSRPAEGTVPVEPGAFSTRDVRLPDGRAALLTYPVAALSAPAVLIIPGGEAPDRDGTIEPPWTGSDEPTKPLRQVGEYLAARGYATLRFDLRASEFAEGSADGVAGAVVALDALLAQPEVDASRISAIAYDDSAAVGISLAERRPEITSLVLLAPIAEAAGPSYWTQLALSRQTRFAEEALDGNGDGSISVSEGLPWAELDDPVRTAWLAAYYIDVRHLLVRSESGAAAWVPELDIDDDGLVGIIEELLPYAKRELAARFPIESDDARPLRALDEIAGIRARVLISAAGESLIAPPTQAVMLAQELEQSYASDYTLIVYQALGHTFHAALDPWWQALGPMEDVVLADLFAWLTTQGSPSP